MKTGDTIYLPFSVFAADGVTRLTGQASSVTDSLVHNNAASAQPVTIAEIGSTGRYHASFVPNAVGQWDLELTMPSPDLRVIGGYWDVEAKDLDAMQDLAQADILSDATPFAGADVASILSSTSAIDGRLPSDPADESLQQASHAATQAAIAALNDIDQAGVQAAMTAQGYTAARAPGLDNLDVAVSSRSDFDEATDPVELLDSGGSAGTSAAELVSDIGADLSSAHGSGAWDATDAITAQEVRDAMKLAPTGGAPAAGSVDERLGDILTDTSAMEPVVTANIDAAVSSRSSHNAADVDTALSATHGPGSWEGTADECHLAVAYVDNAGGEQIRISAWLDRSGVTVTAPTDVTIAWYSEGGSLLFSKSLADAEVTGPDARGVFTLVTAAGAFTLAAKRAGYCTVAITDGAGTVTTTRGVPTAG